MSRKILRSPWPALYLHALDRTHTEMQLQGGVPRFPLPISHFLHVTVRVRPAMGS